jgi:hypothetical protein
MRNLTLAIILAIVGCSSKGEKHDWVDEKCPGCSEEFKRGYRDYYSDVGREYQEAMVDITRYKLALLVHRQCAPEDKSDCTATSTKDLKRDLTAGLESCDIGSVPFQEVLGLESYIATMRPKIAATEKAAAAARRKLEARTTNPNDYWDGWKLAAMAASSDRCERENQEDEQALREGQHLKKVLKYAR